MPKISIFLKKNPKTRNMTRRTSYFKPCLETDAYRKRKGMTTCLVKDEKRQQWDLCEKQIDCEDDEPKDAVFRTDGTFVQNFVKNDFFFELYTILKSRS